MKDKMSNNSYFVKVGDDFYNKNSIITRHFRILEYRYEANLVSLLTINHESKMISSTNYLIEDIIYDPYNMIKSLSSGHHIEYVEDYTFLQDTISVFKHKSKIPSKYKYTHAEVHISKNKNEIVNIYYYVNQALFNRIRFL